MNRLEYFLSQNITNAQPYNVYAHQDAYALIVSLLPGHLLELVTGASVRYPKYTSQETADT